MNHSIFSKISKVSSYSCMKYFNKFTIKRRPKELLRTLLYLSKCFFFFNKTIEKWDILIFNFFQGSGVFFSHETLIGLPELLYNTVAVMDSLFNLDLSDESNDIPQTDNFVWILGKKYNSKKG